MDRGHQAPSADFSSNLELMKESFTLSNAVPQQGDGFNRHIWKEFEDLVRKLAKDRGEIFVITGPINREPNDEDEITIKADANPCTNEIKLEGPKSRTAICGKGNKCPDEGAAKAWRFRVATLQDHLRREEQARERLHPAQYRSPQARQVEGPAGVSEALSRRGAHGGAIYRAAVPARHTEARPQGAGRGVRRHDVALAAFEQSLSRGRLSAGPLQLCGRDLAPEARDEVGGFAGRTRRARQIALHLGAAGAAHQLELLLGFDPLGGRLDAEAVARGSRSP